jgi:hypothetical protein
MDCSPGWMIAVHYIYVTKQAQGQHSAVETLTTLRADLHCAAALAGSGDIPDEYAAYGPTADRILSYLTYAYNKALYRQKRLGLFGTWRNSQEASEDAPKAPWSCRSCGAEDYSSRTEPEPIGTLDMSGRFAYYRATGTT